MPLGKTRNRIPQPGELAVIIGAGKSGIALAKLLRDRGAKVRLLEKNPEAIAPTDMKELGTSGVEIILGEHAPEYFVNASFIVPSPAIPVLKIPAICGDSRAEIVSEMEMAYRHLSDEPIIAVTGTSGKTTCSSMTASMLKTGGLSVFLGGNIGTPLSEYLLDGRKADALVLEVSSFQLQGCKAFAPRVAIMLNISPNHLDYHADMEEYIKAKFRIFQSQNENDLAILDSQLKDLPETRQLLPRKIWLEEQGRFPNMQLFGKHNAINAEAAWQAARLFGISEETAFQALGNFMALPHRLEKVRELNNVLFINDSKSTTVSSLEAAVKSFERPIHLLCGGKFKGGNLETLTPLIARKVSKVHLFGASRDIFEHAWKNKVPMSWSSQLENAVIEAWAEAQPGEVILLSPGTSSFDAYKNYVERGNDFKRIVERLQ